MNTAERTLGHTVEGDKDSQAQEGGSNSLTVLVTALELSMILLVVWYLYQCHMRGALLPAIASASSAISGILANLRSRSWHGQEVDHSRPTAVADIELASTSVSTVAAIPKLLGLASNEAALLNSMNIRSLSQHLPSRVIGKDWQLLFSTLQHGYNLQTLYSKVKNHGPTLLVAMDDQSHVFGGFASRDWSGNDLVTSSMPYSLGKFASRATSTSNTASYFGSGESFIYTANPTFQVYRWTRRNNSFLLARGDCIAFGGGGGKFGLHLDANLDQGTSGTCDTYANAPLASAEVFRVVRVEVWGFVLPNVIRRGAAGNKAVKHNP